jgi:transcriptional regulator with XRE-family HTH domain
MTNLFPPILAKLNTRLKEARLKLGLKQADLAEAGGVTRTAQVRYESGETAPSTDYIHGIQSTGIDVPFILFGCTSNDIVKSIANATTKTSIDWEMVKQAYDDVDYFCSRHAPDCPPSYRWDMVTEIYEIHQSKANGVIPNGSRARQSVVKKIWESQ